MPPLIYRQADFEIHRDFRDEYEDDDLGDGNIFPNQTPYAPHEMVDDGPAPPIIVVVQGPPNVGKSLLIKSLVKYFNNSVQLNDLQGPNTIRIDGTSRIQFVECADDINAMLDASKYADLVLLLVDASFEFEAETFEFLNILQAHGLPKIMGVFTHLDKFNDENKLKETKERLQDHFRTEICQGARIYNLTGLDHGLYKMLELQKLVQDIKMIEFPTLSWRVARPYVLVDRFEDVTPLEEMQKDANCKRNISLYGYLRGGNINSGAKVHIAGAGDFHLASVTISADPCPLSIEMKEGNDPVDPTQMEIESFRTGTYLRLEVCDIPSGMVKNFNPCHPILVGGISLEEENVGYMQARLKRHEWHRKLLKSRDPITVSAGWRRYQIKPIYAMETGVIRLLKFTPEHNHCVAMFWGPLAPPLTRIVVVQSNKEMFRVAAKAVILDSKPAMKIMKKIKQKGTPLKLLSSRTALIDFTPATEVSKYKGRPIQTASGIRGKVKKASKREGIAKCAFKYRIGMGDIVFMRVLRQVEAPRFFNLLSTAVEPCDSIVPVNKDSLEKDDPSQRQVELEQRRGVDIIDGEPLSYSCSSPLILLYNIKNMNGNKRKIKEEKNAVISEEEQKAYEAKMSRRHQVEFEIPFKNGLPMMLLQE
ncbi:hypothetical protein C5167_026929 [Papaver somniferum]|uniref:ribosome biogenesis protein BMS1 homolog isoform X1 n=2 Tax=Papaver somniferum TaxID=3469 RepID=UPI000E703176|nr:ribosome biogenesis protein BMS1 homolog isoform X1 [Papaver somniferum]RZC92296.1 hypothetical protein C5167_026929 [Papaver somniferum]